MRFILRVLVYLLFISELYAAEGRNFEKLNLSKKDGWEKVAISRNSGGNFSNISLHRHPSGKDFVSVGGVRPYFKEQLRFALIRGDLLRQEPIIERDNGDLAFCIPRHNDARRLRFLNAVRAVDPLSDEAVKTLELLLSGSAGVVTEPVDLTVLEAIQELPGAEEASMTPAELVSSSHERVMTPGKSPVPEDWVDLGSDEFCKKK